MRNKYTGTKIELDPAPSYLVPEILHPDILLEHCRLKHRLQFSVQCYYYFADKEIAEQYIGYEITKRSWQYNGRYFQQCRVLMGQFLHRDHYSCVHWNKEGSDFIDIKRYDFSKENKKSLRHRLK